MVTRLHSRYLSVCSIGDDKCGMFQLFVDEARSGSIAAAVDSAKVRILLQVLLLLQVAVQLSFLSNWFCFESSFNNKELSSDDWFSTILPRNDGGDCDEGATVSE